MNDKILIIDDDHDFLNDLAAMLSANFQVNQAQNSRQALRLFNKYHHDLCVIDVDLPACLSDTAATEGIALAEKLCKQNNRQRIIFVSRSALPKVEVNLPSYSFIKKPFLISTLRNHIEHIFGAGPEKQANISA